MRTLTSFAAIVGLPLATLAAACDGDIGPTGLVLPPHVTTVTPADGASVTNADLLGGGSGNLCVGFDFRAGKGMGDSPNSLVRMWLGETEITADLHWVTTADIPPSSGGACYLPHPALKHQWVTARIEYRDVTGATFAYTWRFRVTD